VVLFLVSLRCVVAVDVVSFASTTINTYPPGAQTQRAAKTTYDAGMMWVIRRPWIHTSQYSSNIISLRLPPYLCPPQKSYPSASSNSQLRLLHRSCSMRRRYHHRHNHIAPGGSASVCRRCFGDSGSSSPGARSLRRTAGSGLYFGSFGRG